MLHPYQILEEQSGRFHYKLSNTQLWISRYITYLLPLLVWTMGVYMLLLWEKNSPWWYIPVLALVMLMTLAFAFRKVVFEVDMDSRGVEVVLINLAGKTRQQKLWQEISHIEQDIDRGARGSRVAYHLLLKNGEKIMFAVFPTPIQIPHETLELFSARVRSISQKDIRVSENAG